MEHVYKNIIKFLKEYQESTHTNGYVLGISGGKDSTIVAKLLVDAVGKENVLGVLMPNGEQKDIEDSKRVCELLDIDYTIVNISDAYKSMIDGIQSVYDANLPNIHGGYTKNSGSWVDAIAQTDPPSDYELKAGDYFAFSAGGDNNFEASCAIYNMEFYKHWNDPFYSYGDNRYFSEKVTQVQLEKMQSVMEKEASKNYNILTHTCTHVSLNVWNEMYDEDIDPIGMNTPRNLYSWMNKNGASSNFNLDTVVN